MRSAPSKAFRRQCLTLALLALGWSMPDTVHADAYPLQSVKNVADLLKPNVLVVLETAESMQDLPAENAARYNEVGADCEEGNRSCRLVGQVGRWSVTGMGSQGIKFGDPNASCTATVTNTSTNTDNVTVTDSSTETATHTETSGNTNTKTNTNTNTNTRTNTNTNTTTITQTNTNTTTTTQTSTNTNTNTTTGTVTQTNTNTATATVTTSSTNTSTNTVTNTATNTQTNTVTNTITNSSTSTYTGSNTSVYGPTTYEGENFTTKSTGVSQAGPPAHWAMYSAGYMEQAYAWLPLGTMTITVRAKGDASCGGTGGGYAHFILYARRSDGTAGSWTLGNAYTTGSWADYSFTFSPPVAENYTFQIAFDNDAACSPTDRNLYVDYMTAGGTAIWPFTGTQTDTSTGTASGTNTSVVVGTQTATATGTSTGTSNCSGATVAYEAENLAYSGSPGAAVSVEGGDSNGSLIQLSGTPAVGSYLQFTLPSVTAGTYALSFTAKTWYTRAIVQASIDGTNVGSTIDLYDGSAVYQNSKSVGNVTLSAGSHTLRFTAVGTTGTGYMITVDTITLQAASGACTNTATSTYSSTATATSTSTTTSTSTGTRTASSTSTATGTGTSTGTATATGTYTSSSTQTATSVSTSTLTTTITVTNSSTRTDTNTSSSTATAVQVYVCGTAGSTDPADCSTLVPTDTGYCSLASGTTCTSDSSCSATKGDFCRYISSTDGSGRLRNETCVVSSGSPWGSCKHGVVTANTTCSSSSDTSCASALSGDYCAEGQPAKMCADSGLWCSSVSDCPGDASTDLCVPATSRMMIVKQALRRAVTSYADKVNFGFMSTYQGRGIPATATDASTAIYPYVKLQSCPSSANVTETKLLTRGELEDAGCFDLTNGPASSCTIDYGGNGALNATASLNQITYTKVGTSDSRWLVPRGDGKFDRIDASWSSCSSSAILPACVFSGQGTGLYAGSYYSFTYKQGTPIANSGVDGEGSRAHPVYFTTYRGKFYSDGVSCYNAVDTDRSDIVNDGIYGRPAYTGNPYSASNEVAVPWSGSSNTGACDATTGASWNSNAVPMLSSSDTVTFGGKSLTRSQRALMIAARLEKASFGGVDATGTLAPIGCALDNDGASDSNHSAAAYLSAVRTSDETANASKTPCWSNNIVLVVDGQSSGPGDSDTTGAIDCASTQCAYNQATNPTLTGCNCTAITKAYNLARSGIQTHVVVNAPSTWSARYPYTYAFLWNLAVAGSPNFDGTPSFGTTPEELYKGISDKIAAAAYHFTYTTSTPVPGATTQNPTSQVLSYSNYLFDTSVSYPAWQGNVRAFDTTSSVVLSWSALTTAANGHPASWKDRRIYFSDSSGNVANVQIAGDGSISNAAALNSAGLGASSTEAERIMQWLLGKPELGNPAPLMGSITSSTPIVVGQGAVNGLNGSTEYSASTWKRPQLVYVGGDDGMLHAFFARNETLNGNAYSGGEEAFAFIPNDMLPVITKMYAQGGQNLSVDKSKHIFGLAGSPKVKDMCIGSGCESSTGADWHTVLVMPEGPGGNSPFALDITNVVDATSGLHPGNMSLLWSGATLPSSPYGDTYEKKLGETTSVPAFYFAGYSGGTAKNRVVFASGYPLTPRTTSGYASQGLVLVNADPTSGAVIETKDITSLSATSCSQTRAVRADVTLARDYSSLSTSQDLMGAYVADTWGNTYQYVPGSSSFTKLYDLGCSQPIYFAPAVVQLDRAPKADTSSKHYIYLAQVTNSNLDPDTMLDTSMYSQIVVTKLDGNVSPPTIVSSYNPFDAHGQIVLTVDPAASANNRICIQSISSGTTVAFTDSAKKMNQTCAEAGGEPLPSTARPVGTPTAILRGDGLGFQIITSWYDPTTMTNDCSGGSEFDYGKSYITVHEFGADGTWYQIAGVTVNNAILTGATFVGTGLFIDGINGSSAPESLSIGESFSTMQQINNNSAPDRYLRTSWTERLDL